MNFSLGDTITCTTSQRIVSYNMNRRKQWFIIYYNKSNHSFVISIDPKRKNDERPITPGDTLWLGELGSKHSIIHCKNLLLEKI